MLWNQQVEKEKKKNIKETIILPIVKPDVAHAIYPRKNYKYYNLQRQIILAIRWSTYLTVRCRIRW
jgi:hypothetical protein